MKRLKRIALHIVAYLFGLALLLAFIQWKNTGEFEFKALSKPLVPAADNTGEIEKATPTQHAGTEQKEKALATKNNVNMQSSALANASQSAGTHGQFFCRDNSKGAIANKKQLLYKWLNAEGNTEYSDRAPDKLDYQVVDFGGGGKDYFALRSTNRGAKLSVDSLRQLENKITKTYQILGRMINVQKMRRVEIDLLLLGSDAEYQAVRRRVAPMLSAKNIGFYSGFHNKAVVHSKTVTQTETTAIHESVHVINNGMMMSTPRWLNEGLAEYFEGLKAFSSAAEVSPIPYQINWLKNYTAVPVAQLLNSDDRWSDAQLSANYASSWALVYFFMNDRQHRGLFSAFLNQVIDDGCNSTNSYTWMQNHYPGGVKNLQSKFTRWLIKTRYPKHFH